MAGVAHGFVEFALSQEAGMRFLCCIQRCKLDRDLDLDRDLRPDRSRSGHCGAPPASLRMPHIAGPKNSWV